MRTDDETDNGGRHATGLYYEHMMNRARIIYLLALVFPAGLPALSWDAPAFSLAPAQILSAAAQAKTAEGDDAVFLSEEDVYTFNAAGSALYTYHVIYRILSRDGLQRWSTVYSSWQPWRQDTPVIRARVIAPDGSVSELDQRTIADSTAGRDDPDVYTDSRALQAPLPNLAVGSIVEYQILISDRAPLLPAGGLWRVWFAHEDPVLSRKLVVDCPASLALRYVVRGTGSLATDRQEKDGRIRVTFAAANVAASRDQESYLTSHVVPSPCVDFSTGASWAAVARGYADLVERMMEDGSLKAYAASATGSAGAESAARIAAILYRVRADVRYTGIEFGENAIVPYPPAQTLSRGYGDCKDQAVLLAAALRAAGIDARVALLMAGSDPDLADGLPGFGLFNHAIVYLPAQKLWLDPAADFYRPGELPPMDQGREALLVSRDTTALLLTPESTPSQNLIREVKEFRLSESGGATVVETTTVSGSIEAGYRSHFETVDAKEAREDLEGYLQGVYEAKSLARLELSDPRAMDAPFTLVLEAREAGLGFTDESSALVYLRSGSLLDNLPDFLTSTDEEGKPFARANDLRLWEPYVCQYEWRILPPPGFRAAALPEEATLHLGPAVLTQSFRLQPDGSVNALMRFDTVKRVYTPAEAVALHEAAKEFLQGNAIVITFEQVGESLLAAGNYRGALEEFRALAAAHPGEALHRIQISRALLAAGFGRDALLEARAAVGLEPGLATASSNLGWVLIHDPFGRMMGPGIDLDGARAAYARAAELNPSDYLPTYNLAFLYEHNDKLVRYGPGAQLEKAIALYRTVAKDLKGTNAENNLPIDLLYLGRFRELKNELKSSATSRTLQALFVAASAVLDGTETAQKEAARLAASAEERRNVLSAAAQFLLEARRYPQSAELMVAGARGTQSLTQTLAFAEQLKTLTPMDSAPRDESTPRGLLLSLMGTLLATKGSPEDFERYAAESVRPSVADPAQRRQVGLMLDQARGALLALQLSPEILLDMMAKFMKVQTISVDGAYAALLSMPEFPTYPVTLFYLKQESGAFRMVDSGGSLAGIARKCLALLEAGKLDQARAWMRLVWTQHDSAVSFPDARGDAVFSLLSTPAAATAEELRLAAGFMLTRSGAASDAELGVSIVLPRWRAEKNERRRLVLASPLAEALGLLRQDAAFLEVTTALQKSEPNDARALTLMGIALDRAGRTGEADQVVRAQLAAKPGDLALSRILAQRLGGAGRYTEAIAVAKTIVDSGQADLNDYNILAWLTLFLPAPDPALLEGRQIVQRLMQGEEYVLHTLACVLGEAGRYLEAQEVFGKYLEQRVGMEPDPSTWVAYGILAERFGLMETARDAFARVTPEPSYPYSGISSYALARLHLARLGASRN